MTRRANGAASPVLLALGFGAFAVLERVRPLRGQGAAGPCRLVRNMVLAGLSAVAVQAVERPLVLPLARLVARRHLGLVPRLRLPGWVELVAAIALMDYTLYLWHRATHRVPVLWRFHRVHHADLDMDVSTAIRFHFGEFVLGVPYRAAQILLIGVRPRSLALWQRLTLAEVMFHHSNLRLPSGLERLMVRLVVTPRMHGIHHSTVPGEMNANWSSGLPLWDRLHGTLKLNIPQTELEIGVPELRRPEEVTLPRLLAMPFGRQGRATRPLIRPPLPSPPAKLAP